MTARPGRYAALLFFTAAFVLAAGDKAGTCSCFRTPVCGMGIDDRADAALVFLGVVSQTTRSSTRFRVERVLSNRGIAPAVTYDIGATGSNCDLGFTSGGRYLVYAWQHPETGALSTSMCSRTRLATDSQAIADIAYFDARDSLRSTNGWLSGVVEEQHYDASRGADGFVRGVVVQPLAGIPVVLTSPRGEKRSTRTDAHGVYVFSDLTPSWDPPYQLYADLPRPFLPHQPPAMRGYAGAPGVLWMRNATCAEANIVATVDGAISGRVLDDRGRPARRVVMEVANAETLSADPKSTYADRQTVSDDNGRFELRPLPAGRYYVGVNLKDWGNQGTLDRRRFYPGVRGVREATAVDLKRGERLQLDSFRLPPLPADRALTVVLVAPSPEVAAGTRVFLTGVTREQLPLVSGSLTIRLPYGANYAVNAEPPGGYYVSYARTPHGTFRINQLEAAETDRTITITVQPNRR